MRRYSELPHCTVEARGCIDYYRKRCKRKLLCGYKEKITIEGALKEYVCPICEKGMANPQSTMNSFRGMLAIHIKHKHKDIWKGTLKDTLEALAHNPRQSGSPDPSR